jgi:hypothetical protein
LVERRVQEVTGSEPFADAIQVVIMHRRALSRFRASAADAPEPAIVAKRDAWGPGATQAQLQYVTEEPRTSRDASAARRH